MAVLQSLVEDQSLETNTTPDGPVQLPADVACYSRTATFTKDSVPAGLLKDHSTKAGVWGLLEVWAGQLTYHVTDPRRPESTQTIQAGGSVVIEPTILHRVELSADARFHVWFFREPA